jgi:hypothetical protein
MPKTLTEFAAPTLKNAAQTKADLLAAGKTAEELPAALGEALKVEGDKLTYLLNALEAAGERTNDLKRVLVCNLAEGESAPSGFKKIGEQYYGVEQYTLLRQPKPDAAEERGGRGGRRDGKRGDKKGGDRGDNRGPRGPRRDDANQGGASASPRAPRVEGARLPLPKPNA